MPSSSPAWVEVLKPSGPQGSELLQQERAKSNLSVEKLSEFLHTKEALNRQQKVLNLLKVEKIFDKSQNHNLGRVERLQQLTEQESWSLEDLKVANELTGETTPYGLHASMFLVTLREQGTAEQHRIFLEQAQKYKIIGCYAQTELGHGSNMRGLETTAT